MRDFDKVAAPYAATATREEWLRLQQQRPRPEPMQELTPDNAHSADIKAQSATRQEDRIAFLNNRLDRSQERLDYDHSFARLNGHARADFERGR